jgi:hypothetical protein
MILSLLRYVHLPLIYSRPPIYLISYLLTYSPPTYPFVIYLPTYLHILFHPPTYIPTYIFHLHITYLLTYPPICVLFTY